MDFIPAMVGADGVIRGPAGDGRLSAILRDDVAAAVAVVLTSAGHDGRSYDLTGPAAFSLSEAAELMSRATVKPIVFQNVRGWVSSYWAIRDGSLESASADVRSLTGREPVSLAEYVQAHPEALDHVQPAPPPSVTG